MKETTTIRPFFILFTGLSGAGKSTLANELKQKLNEQNISNYVLDGDVLRKGINKDLSFSIKDRKENLRRMAEIASLFLDAGTIVLSAFIAPLEESRHQIKEIVGPENYLEIFINTSLKTCKERDVKGLYAKAEKGEIQNMTGIDSPYETPKNPFIQIEETSSIEESIATILKAIHYRLH